MESSRPFFGIRWAGVAGFPCTILALWLESFPFYLSHDRPSSDWLFAQLVFCVSFTLTIVTMVSFKSLWIKGKYGSLATADEGNLAAAECAIFLVAYYLVKLGYFLGLSKSILIPMKIVPYLGFMADSSRETSFDS